MKYLIDRPKRPTMNAHLSRLRERTSAFRAHGVLYNDFDREQVGNHVAAVVPVMLVGLEGPIGIFGTGQQGVLAGFSWCQPVKFPTPPCMRSCRIEKMRFSPGLAAVGAHGDLRHLSLACPCSAEDDVGLVRRKGFVNPWPGDG